MQSSLRGEFTKEITEYLLVLKEVPATRFPSWLIAEMEHKEPVRQDTLLEPVRAEQGCVLAAKGRVTAVPLHQVTLGKVILITLEHMSFLCKSKTKTVSSRCSVTCL